MIVKSKSLLCERVCLCVFLGVLLLMPAWLLSAADESEFMGVARAIDIAWILLATFLVFLMHAGFAMVETGFTRAKNAGNILMKNFMTICGGSISYWVIGFAIMFGVSAAGFLGTGSLFLVGDWSFMGLQVPVNVFFKLVLSRCMEFAVYGAR